LKDDYRKDQLREHDVSAFGMVVLRAIQKTIAGFLNEQVIPISAEFYNHPDSPVNPNDDEYLFDD
jgi:hypothetical protein